MILTRGLRVGHAPANLGLRPLEGLSARSFSSASKQSGVLRSSTLRPKTSPFTVGIQRPSLMPKYSSAFRNVAAVRFNSSSTSTEAATNASIPTSTPNETVSTTLDSASDTIHQILDSNNISLGYLKSLGLDYGWGPTSIIQFLLESVHILAGNPAWWTSIALTALATRLLMLKFTIDASDNAAKMQNTKHLTAPLQTKMREAAAARDVQTQMACREQYMLINRRAGIKMWKSFVPLTQIFWGVGAFRLLRGMGELPVPGMLDGGLLWWSNLAVPDPYYVLPMITSLIMYRMMKKGGELGVQQQQGAAAGMMKIAPILFPFVSFAITASMPAGLQWSFLCGSMLGAVQSSLLQRESIRRALGLTIANPKVPAAEEDPFGGLNVSQRVTKYQGPSKSEPATPAQKVENPGFVNGMMNKFQNNEGVKTIKKSISSAAESARKMSGEVPGKRSKQEISRLRELDAKADALRAKKLEEERELHLWKKAQRKQDKTLWQLSEEALEQEEQDRIAREEEEAADRAREAKRVAKKGKKGKN